MEIQQGFYKKDNTQLLFGTMITGPDYMLLLDDKDNYTYPVDGWIYANSLDEAIQIFAQPIPTEPFLVLPENIYLDTSRDAETEFNKLVTLLQLALEQGKLGLDSNIEFFDAYGNKHFTTVSRFFEVVVDYGLFCYRLRFG